VGDPKITPPFSEGEREAFLRRQRGHDQQGTVGIRDFDQGLIETMGAFVEDQRYWLTIPGIDPPPGRPGVLVTFSFPEAEFKSYVLPLVLIRRDDISPAMERWHPGCVTYRTPPADALPVKLPDDGTINANKAGHDRREMAYQATPFDITYTISCLAHYRGAPGQRGQVQSVFHHVLRTYGPYSTVLLHDSLGDPREYHTFTESTSVLDEHSEIADRIIGLAVSLRVEAELDLYEPGTFKTVTQPLTINLRQL
jgi:hypothetical protein